MARLGLVCLEDAFFFFPRRYEDRRTLKSVSEAQPGDRVCVEGIITSRGLVRLKGGQSLLKAVVSDGVNSLWATWFNQPYLLKVLTPRSRGVFYGIVEKEGRQRRMLHPEYELFAPLEDGKAFAPTVHTGRIVPVYGLTEDLGQKGLRQFLFRVTQEYGRLAREILPTMLRRRLRLSGLADALREIHFPSGFETLEQARRRLVFDEFFLMQVAIQSKRLRMQKKIEALSHSKGDQAIAQFTGSLGFELTTGQAEAIRDIVRDMKRPVPMNRLLQGDVGSGKTAVSAAALLFTVANGFQGALMAPTEVLAQQHFISLSQMLEPLGVRLGYLGQGEGVERADVLEGLSSGRIDVAVGTHALIQPDVRFKRLGLAVVDEQHKFGVLQRGALRSKAADGGAHFLLMTATPIPRTLSLTLYGDLDISVMRELPKGRKPVTTVWAEESRRPEIYDFVKGELGRGRQVYVICPLISDEGGQSLKSATDHHRELQAVFAGHQTGLLHGRMKSTQKNEVMRGFKSGDLRILVSTVVIEVGVDVSNASVMIIENAERFGMAQLHQLRGRVGRGSEEAFCFLFSDSRSAETAQRLEAFERTSSGFDIAEKDLEFRGGGDLAGQKQHGLPELRIGDLVRDARILDEARRAATELLSRDPVLRSVEHAALRSAIEKRFAAMGGLH